MNGTESVFSSFQKLSLKTKMIEIAEGKRGKNLALPEELYNKLYDYQKEGVQWLFNLYERRKGGILGDDMGLGKTIQTISFITGMIDCKFIKAVLIIAPMSVISVWINSFKEFSPRVRVETYHGDKRVREKALERIQDRGGVLLTTYDLVGREKDDSRLSRDGYGDNFKWDYIIADEGHQLKNTSTQKSKGAHMILTKYRIILTGTPLQNNLPELWALFDWTHFGQLLGTKRTFNENYGNAIEKARKKCASSYERALGNEYADSLRKIIEPYLLRRTKTDVGFKVISAVPSRAQSAASDVSDISVQSTMPSLPRKNDLVVWLTLSKEQEDIYRRFLTTEEVQMLLYNSVKMSPLTKLVVLKKICDHPRLLSEAACEELGLVFDERLGEKQNEQTVTGMRVPSSLGKNQDIDDLELCILQSVKTVFLRKLLPQLIDDGHKILVFSMSLRMLNIVAQILRDKLNVKFLRLDGGITKLDERQRIIDKFQTSDRYKVLLLTTQVGGVGLTITAADRVIIVDPAWNPAVDSQAVDRVYRVGQRRNVVVYRLITAGTVEEKIYKRQVFKVSIFKQVAHSSKSSVNAKNIDDPMRYFTNEDLRDLLSIGETRTSGTQQQLEKMHAHERVSDEDLDMHLELVKKLSGVVGISDHDLLFSKKEDDDMENIDQQAIKQRVYQSQAAIQKESEDPDHDFRTRMPLSDRQLPTNPLMYPQNFGSNSQVFNAPQTSKTSAMPIAPKPYENFKLPMELPPYLIKKGLVKEGQSVLTPPKPLGKPPITKPSVPKPSEVINLDTDSSRSTVSLDEEVMVISPPKRQSSSKSKHFMYEQDENETLPEENLHESHLSNKETQQRASLESDKTADTGETSETEQNDQDNDLMIVDNQFAESFISPRKSRKGRVIIESDAEDASDVINLDSDKSGEVEPIVSHEVQPSTEVQEQNDDSVILRKKPAHRRMLVDDDDNDNDGNDLNYDVNVIVTDESRNQSSNSENNSVHLSRVSSDSSSLAADPIGASTPFNPAIGLMNRRKQPVPISPLVIPRNSRPAESLSTPNQGTKRPQHERSHVALVPDSIYSPQKASGVVGSSMQEEENPTQFLTVNESVNNDDEEEDVQQLEENSGEREQDTADATDGEEGDNDSEGEAEEDQEEEEEAEDEEFSEEDDDDDYVHVGEDSSLNNDSESRIVISRNSDSSGVL